MTSLFTSPVSRRTALAGLLAVSATAGCANPTETAPTAAVGSGADTITYDTSPQQAGRITHPVDESIAAQLPEAVRRTGTLVVGTAAVAGAAPPLVFLATDNTTPVGAEVDMIHLIADILGLTVEARPASFENLFVGLDAGTYQVLASNVGVSEARKEKYDFATYRLGLHAFEVKQGSTLKVSGAQDIAGKKIGVSSGTLQEGILLTWNAENQQAGRPQAELLYFPAQPDAYLALQSGRIDAWLGPNPTATYHIATAHQTQVAGTVSSAFPIPGLVGITTKKGNGLAAPIAAAIDTAIRDGSYGKVLARWGLGDEAVPASQINPPGLPKKA